MHLDFKLLHDHLGVSIHPNSLYDHVQSVLDGICITGPELLFGPDDELCQAAHEYLAPVGDPSSRDWALGHWPPKKPLIHIVPGTCSLIPIGLGRGLRWC